MVGGVRVGGTVSRVGTLFSSQALGSSVYNEKKKKLILILLVAGGGLAWCTLLGQGNT